jgi:elongation factor G
MKSPAPEKIRNVALVSHGGAGKTSVADALLFAGGSVSRLGKVEDGSSTLDYSEEEKKRQITLSLGLGHYVRNGVKVNVLDCPGYADFYGDVRAGLRVADAAVLLVAAPSGVEVGTELVWQFLENGSKPRIIAVSKMDKEHADFQKAIDDCTEALGARLVPLAVPIGAAGTFRGVVDLITGTAWMADGSGKVTKGEVPGEMADRVEEFKGQLIEAAAEANEELMEKFFAEEPLSPAEILDGLKQGVLATTIVPVIPVAGPSMAGIEQLMNLIEGVLPSPADVAAAKGTKPRSEDEVEVPTTSDGPFTALVFKTVAEQHVGELSCFRVYSGTVSSGQDVFNATQDGGERMGTIYAMNGRDRKELESISAGDIGAVVKLKQTSTSDTLCAKSDPVILPAIDFPKPVLSVAVSGKSKGDEEKVTRGLQSLHEEDPTFTVQYDPVIKQTIISGLGDLHLDVMVDKLKQKFGVDVELEKPKIPYRETVKSTAKAEGKYKKQSGGRGQFGVAWLRVEPNERGAGLDFLNEIVGGSIPSKFIPAVEKGVRERMDRGILAGYPVVDVKVAVYDGKVHPVDSSEMAFKMAGSIGFRLAANDAKPVMLEPVYLISVRVPDEYLGDVMSDVSSRRGRIKETAQEGRSQIVRAYVPLAELYKYSTHLRSITQGRGFYEQEFSHYEEVPGDVQAKLVAEAEQEAEEE